MIIRPNAGVDGISFNMRPAEIESVLGTPRSKTLLARSVEAWLYDGMRVHFDDQSLCHFVEFFEPAIPIVEGIHLFGRWDSVLGGFEDRDLSVRDILIRSRRYGTLPTGTVICEALGVAVGREVPQIEDVESASAFRKGYWNQSEAIRD